MEPIEKRIKLKNCKASNLLRCRCNNDLMELFLKGFVRRLESFPTPGRHIIHKQNSNKKECWVGKGRREQRGRGI